mgnify:CR=1 FL=1
MLTQTEDVGAQFAQQARQMHEGELEPREKQGRRWDEQQEQAEQTVPPEPAPVEHAPLEDLWGRAGRRVGERAGDDPLA